MSKKKLTLKKQPQSDKANKRRERLYHALFFIHQLKKPEDLQLLKSKSFLQICELTAIDFQFKCNGIKEEFLKHQNTDPSLCRFQLTQDLNFKGSYYGEMTFYSFQKFSQQTKSFLKKLSGFTASAIYSIESKEKLQLIKKQWGEAFDSLPQAFCITDKQFKILRSNQAFQKFFEREKKDLMAQNLFQLFPFSVPPIQPTEQSSSLLIQGRKKDKKIYWELSCKTLYLREEQTSAFLFLIKDISQEMELSAKISAKVKDKEMGWIKGSLAHELNNPIAGIKTLLSIIERDIPSGNKSTQENLKEMQKSISVCHEVVKNLLSVSKQESI